MSKNAARRLFPGLNKRPALASAVSEWHLRGAEILAAERPLLAARGLYKAYGGVVPTDNVDIELKTGHIHSLIGPNGAGKTTLLNILSGIVPPDRGSIEFNASNIVGMAPNQISRLGLGSTFQNPKRFADMEILDFLGLRDKAYQRAGSLPYGLQRRLELARALATHPRLGLAPLVVKEIFRVIRSLKARGVTILLVEQMANQALAVAERAYVLETGRITIQGRGADLRRDPKVRAAYLGEH